MRRRLGLLAVLVAALALLSVWHLGGLSNRLDAIDHLTKTMTQRAAQPQYIRIRGAYPDDRTLLVYRAPGEPADAWIARARRKALDGTVLQGAGEVEEKTTTVTWQGITFEIVTRRGTDENGDPESMDEWCKRHEEAVEAWQEKHQ